MSILGFGESVEGINYKVLNEREVRASAGILFTLGLIMVVSGMFLERYSLIPYFSGFMVLSFFVSVFINPKYAPSNIIARLIVCKQKPIYIGAIQKRFAWSCGLAISSVVFYLSFPLQSDPRFFAPICKLCLLCICLMFIETAFGICVGCQFYFLAIKLKLIKQHDAKPNCMGNSCEIRTVEQHH